MMMIVLNCNMTISTTTETKIPEGLRKALAASPKARAQWEGLTPIAQRDFSTWIVSAKQAETRKRRVEKACSMLAAGKRRPCCYAIVPMNLYKALGSAPKAKSGWSALTPTEKRDLIAWLDADKKSPADRIQKACTMLAAGKRLP